METRKIIFISFGIFVLLTGFTLFLGSIFSEKPSSFRRIVDFESCIHAGNRVQETYPRQCVTPDGKVFREEDMDFDVNSQPRMGGDRDEHGCIGSAGYTWCEEKSKCLREWQEPCSQQYQYESGPFDFSSCVKQGNPVRETYPRQCVTPDGNIFTEEF